MIVTAPASSANLGPGFDVLGMALDLPFFFAVGGDCEDLLTARETHPATIAYRAAGGSAPDHDLFWRSPIPPGRGLGFSGAARVAGAFAAAVEMGLDVTSAQERAFLVAADLEGHPDNAAASAFGGVCTASGSLYARLPVADRFAALTVLTWSPESVTTTKSSRAALSDVVERSDAVFNIGRSSMLVAAICSGDLGLLRHCTMDALHQQARLAARADSAEALRILLDDPRVVAGWLSGSGPTVAALVRVDDAAAIRTDDLPPGVVRHLRIDSAGVQAQASIRA